MSRCAHVDREQLQDCCYSCVKAGTGLLWDVRPNGQGAPTERQLQWVGVEDPDTAGAWDLTSIPIPRLAQQLAEREAVRPWGRSVPLHWEVTPD